MSFCLLVVTHYCCRISTNKVEYIKLNFGHEKYSLRYLRGKLCSKFGEDRYGHQMDTLK